MELIYLLTGLCTVVAAIAGLILTCHLERRALAARRGQNGKQTAVRSADSRPIAT